MTAASPADVDVGRGSLPPATPRPEPVPLAESPRIARLAREVDKRGAEALAAFWNEVGDRRTPIVEPSPVPGQVTATFLWRDRGDTRGVLLIANKRFDRDRPERTLLRRLGATDVWHRSLLLPAAWRGSYHLAADDAERRSAVADHQGWLRVLPRHAQPDPLNPDRLRQPPGPDKSIASMPAAPDLRWWAARDVAPGPVTVHEVTGPGDDRGPRRLWVHRPAPNTGLAVPPRVVLLLDGENWAESLPIFPMLDNLHAAGAVAPLLTIAVEGPGAAGRTAELSCNPTTLRWLSGLLDWVRDRWEVAAPDTTVVGGQSLGGLTALHAAIVAPERFPNALVQSGSLWWPTAADGRAGEWLTGRVSTTATTPRRVYLEVGIDEWVNVGPARRMRDALAARGVDVAHHEFAGGHDRACWRGGLADGLRHLASPDRPVGG